MKRLRKKNPKIRILVASEIEQDTLLILTETNIAKFEKVAEELYDVHWPAWRAHGELQISLQFLDEARMAEVNDTYRQISAPTDVLSFPLFEKDGRFIPDVRGLPFTLGDILLCPAIIKKNASGHHVSEESELALIIFHGMLHLLAWDHDTPQKEERMWKAQERFRDLFLRTLSDRIVVSAGENKK